ncbi:Ceramide synthase 5 [Pleodorina starrii]|uniref:Ceramide synthase 5 n=1 Tax=Pleodorina starrii TaxID=330485 RepID=A0A9W6F372_9CHLO|nr:Ceramide synthase 5 [Pleodorina starrii]
MEPTTLSDSRTGFVGSINFLLFEFDSLRLIAPKGDPQYVLWFQERSRSLASYNQLSQLLLPSLSLFAALCLLRIAFFRFVVRRPRGQRRRYGVNCGGGGQTDSHGASARIQRRWCATDGAEGATATAKGASVKDVKIAAADPDLTAADAADAPMTEDELRLGEGCWAMVGGSALLLWGWLCVSRWNGGCPGWPSLDTSHCLGGWPLIPLPPPVRWYYCWEAAWYLHLLAKHHLGVGLKDNTLMVAHHVASMSLLVLSYCFSLHRPGVLLLALLNSSTPLLHLSKTAHHAGIRRVAVPSFAAFAAVYFVSRVLLFPIIFLPLGLVQPLTDIPRVLDHLLATYLLINALLWSLVGMQWVWFGAVIRVLRGTVGGDDSKLEAAARSWEQRRVQVQGRKGALAAANRCSACACSYCGPEGQGGDHDGGSGSALQDPLPSLLAPGKPSLLLQDGPAGAPAAAAAVAGATVVGAGAGLCSCCDREAGAALSAEGCCCTATAEGISDPGRRAQLLAAAPASALEHESAVWRRGGSGRAFRGY